MNNIKRILSCLSILVVCVLANLRADVKAIDSAPIKTIMQNKEIKAQAQQFTLHNGIVQEEANKKLTYHYSHTSHSSHSSHHSHLSSRW